MGKTVARATNTSARRIIFDLRAIRVRRDSTPAPSSCQIAKLIVSELGGSLAGVGAFFWKTRFYLLGGLLCLLAFFLFFGRWYDRWVATSEDAGDKLGQQIGAVYEVAGELQEEAVRAEYRKELGRIEARRAETVSSPDLSTQTCARHLVIIGDSLRMFAEQNGGVYPASLRDLVPDYIEEEVASKLVCPEDESPSPSFQTSYKYLVSGQRVSPERMLPLVMDRAAGHSGQRLNVLFNNGQVSAMTPEQIEQLLTVKPGPETPSSSP